MHCLEYEEPNLVKKSFLLEHKIIANLQNVPFYIQNFYSNPQSTYFSTTSISDLVVMLRVDYLITSISKWRIYMLYCGLDNLRNIGFMNL